MKYKSNILIVVMPWYSHDKRHIAILSFMIVICEMETVTQNIEARY